MIKLKKSIEKKKKIRKVYGWVCIQNEGEKWKFSINWIWLFESWYNEEMINDML